jgi:hypothetical protein
MPRKYASVALAVVIDALAITVVIAVLAIFYWLVSGANGEYLRIVSNALFLVGGIILTFGALIAFFKTGSTNEIRRLIFNPVLPFERLGFFRVAGEQNAAEEKGAGWPLILIGALLILFSFVTSINYLI